MIKLTKTRSNIHTNPLHTGASVHDVDVCRHDGCRSRRKLLEDGISTTLVAGGRRLKAPSDFVLLVLLRHLVIFDAADPQKLTQVNLLPGTSGITNDVLLFLH